MLVRKRLHCEISRAGKNQPRSVQAVGDPVVEQRPETGIRQYLRQRTGGGVLL